MLDKTVLKDFLSEELLDIEENPNDYYLEKMTKDFSEYVMTDYYDWINDNYQSFWEKNGFEKYVKNGTVNIPKIIKKKYFTHKDITLYNNDVLDCSLFDKQFIDLIVTSPPYNVGIDYNSNDDELNYEQYLEFSEKWMANCFLWSNSQARLCMNIPLDKNKGGHRAVGADLTQIAQKIGWKYKTTIIWNEGNISRRTAWGSWKSASAPVVIAPVELIVILYKDEWKKTNGSKISDVTGDEFKEWTNGVWTFNGESKKRIGHPAPFPKELPYRCIKLFSYQNDLVFDPFAGSGTTLLMAQNLNRKTVGIEIDETYCELAKNRILLETNTII